MLKFVTFKVHCTIDESVDIVPDSTFQRKPKDDDTKLIYIHKKPVKVALSCRDKLDATFSIRAFGLSVSKYLEC